MIISSIGDLIRVKHPDWNESSTACFSCIDAFSAQQIQNLLKDEQGRLSELEKEVVASIKDEDVISENPNQEYEGQTSIGGSSCG